MNHAAFENSQRRRAWRARAREAGIDPDTLEDLTRPELEERLGNARSEVDRLSLRKLGLQFTIQTGNSKEWRHMAEDFIEQTPGIAIAASSDDVRAIAKEAALNDYNRRISVEALESLDPDGTHIVTPRLFHEHANGEVVPQHIRAQVFLKVKDKGPDQPVEAWMDIPMDLYQGLARLAKNESTGEWEPVEPGMVREPTAYAPWSDEAAAAREREARSKPPPDLEAR